MESSVISRNACGTGCRNLYSTSRSCKMDLKVTETWRLEEWHDLHFSLPHATTAVNLSKFDCLLGPEGNCVTNDARPEA